ncbi:TniQ family protein [Vibrio harveyi]|uniref:TniQ family protein n=1 Tax=Vibrio harveyi TaxID=669 RepID=UPI0031BA1856
MSPLRSAPMAHVQLLPGEHVLSVLGRAHLYSSYRKMTDSLGEITDDLGVLSPGTIWRPAYNHVHQQWGEWLSLEEFAARHTLLNYYTPFTPSGSIPQINEEPRLAPPSARVVRYTTQWRYCPECAERDVESYGVPYFHFEHQLPCLTHCQEHQSPLKSVCLGCGNDWQKLGKLLGPPLLAECAQCGTPLGTVDSYWDEDVAWLQKVSLRLLKGEFAELNLAQLQSAYQQWLGLGPRSGVLNLKDRLIVKEAQIKLENHFDPRLFRLIFTNADTSEQSKRTPTVSIYKAAFKDVALPPVVHLLLIRMMFGELERIPK